MPLSFADIRQDRARPTVRLREWKPDKHRPVLIKPRQKKRF